MIKPFFSVVILTFNRPEKLKRALDSIAKQTFTDFDVVVVDGGSANDAREKLANHILKPAYYHMQDEGIGKARDFGLQKATGEWVAFLDDDDEYKPEHLENRKKLIDENPETDLFYNGFETVGSRLVPDLVNEGKFLDVDDEVISHAGTVVIKTAKALAAGGFKDCEHCNYPDDFHKLAEKGNLKTFRIIEPRTYIYNRYPDSYTGKLEEKYKKM